MRAISICLILVFLGLGSSCATPSTQPLFIEDPQLHFDASVALDFRNLADETWSQFLSTFAARKDCFGDVTLRTDSTLESRAKYDPESAIVIVKVPGTPAFLQAALVHEWAHHVEFQCDAHQALRPIILEILDRPANAPWRVNSNLDEADWANTPSEHYAEAAVELVLGDHPLPTKIRVDPEIVAVLEKWVCGD